MVDPIMEIFAIMMFDRSSMEIFAVMMLAGIWRTWDGTGLWLPTWARNLIGFVVALGAGHIAFDWPYAGLAAAIVMVSMIKSVSLFIPKGWGSWWMTLRYSIPAVFICIPGWFGLIPIVDYGVWFIGTSILAGAVYPFFTPKTGQPDIINWRVVEFIAGTGAIGGLALL